MATARTDTLIRHLRRAVLRQEEAGWTDGQLLTSFIDEKDQAAFEALVHRHGPMVFGVCRRVVRNHHDAEDAFQATFLVLARKSSSIRPREKLAGWLHGVALRTALKAQATTAKRRGREKQIAEVPEPEAAPQDQWGDLPPLVDQELNGLPEIYRLPLLYCDLKGRTIKEASQQLGWPQGTLAGRLARGRKLLAKRLANRGVGPFVLAVAAPTPMLMNSTVQAANLLAAGQATLAEVVPAEVAVLTEGVLKAMSLTKCETATVGLLVVAFLLGTAGAFCQTQTPQQMTGGQRSKTTTDGAASPAIPSPPKVDVPREYRIVSRLMDARGGEPQYLVKMVVEDGQLVPLGLLDGPQNLLAKVVDDENLKIGTFLDVRVRRLMGNKVRLTLSFQKNEVEKASVNEIQVLGHSAQTIQVVELRQPVKVVFQKDEKGAAQRWVEITVDELAAGDERSAPPPAAAGPPPNRALKQKQPADSP